MDATNEVDLAHPEQDPAGEPWRSEVASRVNHYRARRKRKCGGENSLRLDFEQLGDDTPSQSETLAAVAERFQSSELTCDTNYYRRLNAEAVAASTAIPGTEPRRPQPAATYSAGNLAAAAEPVCETSTPTGYDPDFDFDLPRGGTPGAPESRVTDATARDSAADEAPAELSEAAREDGNLIFFPVPPNGQRHPGARSGYKPAIRLPVEPPTVQPQPRDQLAEPVFNPPRILDVPEAIIPTIDGPLFADIRLDCEMAQDEAAVDSAPTPIDLPLQVAMIPQRVFAAAVDWLIVVGASAIFVAILCRMLPELPQGRLAHAALVIIPLMLWTIYQHLLLVYGGKTVGMEMAQLSLHGFDGRLPGWKERKRRVYCMLFSLLSLGLGYAWALVDEDCLCWHDRITRTFTTGEQ